MSIEHRGVRIPSTPDDWQLYTCKPSSIPAAQALTAAAKTAVDKIAEARVADLEGLPWEALRPINEVCEAHAKAGAADSEPYCEARHVVIRAMKTIAGVEVDPWSL